MKSTSKRQRQITNLLLDSQVFLKSDSQKFYVLCAISTSMDTRRIVSLSLALLMISFTTLAIIENPLSAEDSLPDSKKSLDTNAMNPMMGSNQGHIDTYDTLSVGIQFTCVVTDNSSVICWGRTDYGETGSGLTGSEAYHNASYVVGLSGVNIVEVAAHWAHACALSDQGDVYCRGRNSMGMLGNGGTSDSTTPVQVSLPPGVQAASLSQGPSYHSCIISTDGDGYCWGNNNRGQLGNGEICDSNTGASTSSCHNNGYAEYVVTPQLVDMPVGVGITSISMGGDHTCATGTDLGVYCWGSDMNCRVTGGDTTTSITGEPVCRFDHLQESPKKLMFQNTAITIPDKENLSFVQVAVGWVFSCGLTDAGSIICWGANTESQQGIGSNSNNPAQVVPTETIAPSGEHALSISASTAQACALFNESGAFCWGDNWGGNAGDYDGTNDWYCNYTGGSNGGGNNNCADVSTPNAVWSGENDDIHFTSVVMGASNTCGIMANSSLYCWGAYAWNGVNGSVHNTYSGVRLPLFMPMLDNTSIPQTDLDIDGDGILVPFDMFPNGCPPGWYQDSHNSCDESPRGNYAESSNPWNLVACSPGTYQPNAGQTECLESDPGYYVPASGEHSQMICPAGSYQPDSASDSCLLADPGYMVGTPGKIDQTACNAGRFSSSSGSTECVRAQPGFYVADSGSAEEVPCSPGSYTPAHGSISCISTSPGLYTNTPASTQPISCDPGSYQPDFNQDSCLLAPAGHYVSESMASSYQPCLSGHYQSSEGMTECVTTSPGTYTPGASFTAPLDCSAGTYQPSAGAERCIDAFPGSYVASEGSIEVVECSPGTYQPQSGQSACIEADPGHYITLRAAKSQIPCPVTTFQPQTGQTACMDAEPGHYADGVGTGEQMPCDAGEYQPSSKSTNCRIVPAGHYSVGLGSIDFIACMPGTYQPTSCMSDCIDADEGNYVGESSQLMQTPCSKGTYQPSTGSSECLSAGAGYFVESTGAVQQTPCEAGSYQPIEGRSNCIYSSINNYVPEAGSADQTACPSGEHQPTPGQTGCIEKEDEGGLLPGFSSFTALMTLLGAAVVISTRKQE